MPVTWDEYVDGKALCLDADLDATDWDGLSKQYVEAFDRVLTNLASRVPAESWNRLYIERWLDVGRLIVCPIKRGKKKSDLLLEATLDSEFVQREYEALEAIKPKRYRESHIMALDGKLKVALRNALSVPAIAGLLERLAQETDFTIWTMEEGDTESQYQLYL